MKYVKITTERYNKQINKVCVVIPIYKDDIDEDEKMALRRMLEVFKDEEIVVTTYKKLDLPTVLSIFKHHHNYRIEYFSNFYFKNVERYNHLMLSKCFYNRFKDYEYILISQLDVYVFSNQLEYWCNQSFDYIGAPLFNHITDVFDNHYNGGFSLRRIDAFLKKYDSYYSWLRFFDINNRDIIHSFLRLIYATVTYYNIRIAMHHVDNEDVIWSRLDKVPTFEKSSEFAFEKNPSILYSKIGKLPFGCHAYLKWNDGFYNNIKMK